MEVEPKIEYDKGGTIADDYHLPYSTPFFYREGSKKAPKVSILLSTNPGEIYFKIGFLNGGIYPHNSKKNLLIF